ncbi:Prolyl-tRNA synthetase [Flexistipes sinusarabici DSM 4947]|uniref:Proline--tRNA ligase n=2 Tax=Flexistipes sinusarabici TaxID=2352 RepID=F8E5K8_FLESM|nr:proline--tRNA ligase [Flexistipes sinusarabici]AEI15771.1 Prolyl-tRNA synthetase [Flexistipes sinusarabici DSM 4947]
MRLSNYFTPTLRETPAEAEVVSHKLMLRAGMIRKSAAGIYSYLPLGLKVIQKVEQIVRKYMNEYGAVELLMPAVCSADLWRESGRWADYGKELLRIKDRHGRDFCIGPTHEEVITDIVRNSVKSYKQLPLNLYQIQTKFRDEVRPRFGLMRGREFIMKDAYSFDINDKAAEKSYKQMHAAYCKIFESCNLKYKVVEADSGAIGGSFSHEFMVLADTGEDFVISCNSCDYSANMEKAVTADNYAKDNEKILPSQQVKTPGQKTVEDVANFLDVNINKIVKTLILKTDDDFVALMVRGDHEANLVKLKNYLDVVNVDFASEKEIEEITGGAMGFSGPVNLPLPIYADNAVKYIKNFVVGGNAKDVHLKNVNIGEDFTVKQFGDFRTAEPGDECPKCGKGTYVITKGIEVGHIFKLGTKYSESMNATYLDKDGKQKHMIMGCYGIGIGRTAAAAIEQNHDDAGIIWPPQLAPFEVVVVPVNTNDENVVNVAETIYLKLLKKGVDVVIDDRDERAGVKFNDADLIGYPLRINVGKKTLKEGNIEIFIRKDKELISVKREDSVNKTLELLESLKSSGK